jgi:ribosomal protein S18 acetylase RimI-like enzyme
MTPIIKLYCKVDKDGCLAAFISNVPKYFTTQEVLDFGNFLDRVDNQCIQDTVGTSWTKYYVMFIDDKVIGCGGFGDKDGTNIISLAWGLVHNEFHGMGYGKLLLEHRLKEIKIIAPNNQLVLDPTQHSFWFFEKYGFQTIKITPDYYAKDLHRYDMVFS